MPQTFSLFVNEPFETKFDFSFVLPGFAKEQIVCISIRRRIVTPSQACSSKPTFAKACIRATPAIALPTPAVALREQGKTKYYQRGGIQDEANAGADDRPSIRHTVGASRAGAERSRAEQTVGAGQNRAGESRLSGGSRLLKQPQHAQHADP